MSSRLVTTQTAFGEVRQWIGPYRVLETIGHGGMATVYKALQPELDRIVAVKVLLPAFANDAGFRARFEREARMIARLRHPNIVGIYGADEDAGMPYLVMEYLDGMNLQAALRQRRASGESFTPADVLALFQSLAQALDYAHALGVIHRDLKPENIILTANGPVITDFGLAKLLMEEAATVSVVMGTPSYMAPEHIQAEPVDARSDVYALGIILYELLTGRVPFTGPTPYAIAQAHIAEPVPSLADLDPRWARAPLLNEVARRAIAKRKADRWPSAGALVAALARALDAPLDVSSRPTLPARAMKTDTAHLPPPPLAAPSRLRRPPSGDKQVARWVLLVPLVVLLVAAIVLWSIDPWSRDAASNQPESRPSAVLATVVPSESVPQTGTVPPNTPALAGVRAVVRPPTGAFMREGPGTAYPVVGGLPNGTTVTLVGVSGDWFAVATPDDRRGWIAGSLLEVTQGDVAALPRPTVQPPRVAPATPTAAPVTAAGPVRLEDTAFVGGWRNRGASIYGGRSATWVYGQGSNYSTMTASFQANAGSRGTGSVRIVGMDSEDAAKTPMRVLLNDTVIFEGRNPLPNDDMPLESGRWDELDISFDGTLLRDGTNTLSITNLANGPVGLPPFVALDYAIVQLP